MTQEFTIIIEKDPESGWLVGSVAELPGCYPQAPTMNELELNIQEAIRVYLDTVGEEELIEQKLGERLSFPIMEARSL